MIRRPTPARRRPGPRCTALAFALVALASPPAPVQAEGLVQTVEQQAEGSRAGIEETESAVGARHEAWRSELDTYFERLTRFGFSGAVSVAHGDRVVMARGYGLADRESGRPFLPSTVVTIGSITKPLTAALVLDLAEDGLVDPAAPISDYLPGVPPDKRGITLHHLLTHTSGLQRNGLEGGDLNLEATRDSVLSHALESELLSSPGDSYRYSNLGYTLLAMIAENASGLPYEELLLRRVLIPARMYRTGYLAPAYQDGELAAGYRGEQRLEPVIRLPMLEDGPTWNLRGNGGVHSDAYDMLRWIAALRSGDVLSHESLDLMLRPHADRGDGTTSYGYGWEIADTATGGRDVSHSGGNGYFAADLHWLPDDRLAFFVASNDASRVNMARLSGTLESILLNRPYVLPPRVVEVSNDVLERYAGRYRLPGGGEVTVLRRVDGLVIRAEDDRSVQAVLGGERGLEDPVVRGTAERSRALVTAEFAGDFEPKREAMGGTVTVADLKRYHDYDREAWNDAFGSFQEVEITAASGERSEVRVVVRISFERGAAAQIHTWRQGRLANVSVIPDWSELEMERTLHAVADDRFESFDIGSSVRLIVEFRGQGEGAGGEPVLAFPRRPGEAGARRHGPSATQRSAPPGR